MRLKQHRSPCVVSAPRAAPENTKKNRQVKPNKTWQKMVRWTDTCLCCSAAGTSRQEFRDEKVQFYKKEKRNSSIPLRCYTRLTDNIVLCPMTGLRFKMKKIPPISIGDEFWADSGSSDILTCPDPMRIFQKIVWKRGKMSLNRRIFNVYRPLRSVSAHWSPCLNKITTPDQITVRGKM